MNTSSHGYFQNPVTATHSTLEEYASHQYNNFNGHHPSGGALPRSAPYPPRAPPTGSIVNMGNPEDTFEICVRHNRRRPRRQLVEITNAAGMTVLECLPGHMCRDKPPGTAQRRPREQDQGMGPRRTPEIAHSNATLNMGTTPVSDGSHLGGNWGQEVETKEATHVKVRQVLCVRHAKVRYLDECNEIEAGGVHVCSEHSDCLRSGPVDDMETVQRRLASLFEVQGPRDRGVKNQDDLNEASVRSPYGTTKALLCSLHGYPRTLNYLKKDATSSGFCCFFPHQCRQRSLTSPKYHVLDSSLEFIRDA